MNTALLILLIVAIAAVAAGAIWRLQKRRSEGLKRRFGSEYNQAVSEFGDKRKAESELERREKRVERFHIRTLTGDERARFAEAWRADQSRFVDQPREAVLEAHRLVNEVMRARGYPVSEEFEHNAEDLSVRHGSVVQHYREACEIAARREKGQANTEDMRAAMVHYRALFEELLGTNINQPEEVRR